VDWRVRTFSAEEISHLSTLALEVVNHFELHRRDCSVGRNPERLLRDALDPLRLRSAIEDAEFVSRYQPIVNMSTGEVVAIEALTRWQHPELGVVPASLFLPAMEYTGLMISLGRQVIAHALDTVQLMSQHLLDAVPPVTVNISPEELRSEGLCDFLVRSCDAAQVDPSALMLEITESAPLPGDAAIRELERIRDLGIGIALDDFGSGVATLSQVVKLPISTLKIDRSLLIAASNEVRHQQVLSNALELASSMGLNSCVEGVETEEQRTLLQRLGARHGQGWLFTSALDGPQLVHYLEENGTSTEWSSDIVRESHRLP
jgi:EAL domain-containing protein (putative c-di-GMP-specific phosphodiesterase class I)